MGKSPKPTFVWSVTQHLTLGLTQAQTIAQSLMHAVLSKRQSGAYAIWYDLKKQNSLLDVVGKKGLPFSLCQTLIKCYEPTGSDLDHKVLLGILIDGCFGGDLSVGWRNALVNVMNSQAFLDWAVSKVEVQDDLQTEDITDDVTDSIDMLTKLGYTVKSPKTSTKLKGASK